MLLQDPFLLKHVSILSLVHSFIRNVLHTYNASPGPTEGNETDTALPSKGDRQNQSRPISHEHKLSKGSKTDTDGEINR